MFKPVYLLFVERAFERRNLFVAFEKVSCKKEKVQTVMHTDK
jgi:hypothetical protein